jgi:hypothetical protein
VCTLLPCFVRILLVDAVTASSTSLIAWGHVYRTRVAVRCGFAQLAQLELFFFSEFNLSDTLSQFGEIVRSL